MPCILIRMKNVEEVSRFLADGKYKVTTGGPLTPEQPIQDLAEEISGGECHLVIINYVPDDAYTVKLMQAVLAKNDQVEFILVDEDNLAGKADLFMAVNEGARAFLPGDFSETLLTYWVEKSLAGPGRFSLARQYSRSDDLAARKMEEQLGQFRIRGNSYQTLIPYILSTPVSAQARQLLIVSDSPYQLEMMRKLFEAHNFTVYTAGSFDEGLKEAIDKRPKIIVSDLDLGGGKTGPDLCGEIKFKEKIVPCYFVVSTANQSKIEHVLKPGNGIDDCILKPSGQSDANEFVSRVALGLLLLAV